MTVTFRKGFNLKKKKIILYAILLTENTLSLVLKGLRSEAIAYGHAF